MPDISSLKPIIKLTELSRSETAQILAPAPVQGSDARVLRLVPALSYTLKMVLSLEVPGVLAAAATDAGSLASSSKRRPDLARAARTQ